MNFFLKLQQFTRSVFKALKLYNPIQKRFITEGLS